MISPFDVTSSELTALDPNAAVDFFRRLLWAKATTKGISVNEINVPSNINDNDGGIDATVKATVENNEGLIKNGITGYQIKTGKLKIGQRNEIKSILFNTKSGRTILKPRIKYVLDNGTLVIVLFGSDKVEKTEDEIIKSIKEILGNEYENSKIEIIQQNSLIELLQPHLALCLRLKGTTAYFHTHEEWKHFSDMQSDYKTSKQQQQKIDSFRELLLEPRNSINIRVTGEPGIGKTRFVLKVTDIDELSPLVVYLEDPSKLSGELLSLCIREDVAAILIIDECDSSTQKDIWNKLKSKSPPLKLVTIFNEPDESKSCIIPEPLEDHQIGEILKEYGIPEDKISKWISFCTPSPRAAHIIGKNIKENNNLLDSDDAVDVWNRYIAERSLLNSDEFKKRKEILLWLSLFKKFGYVEPFEGEGEFIAKQINRVSEISCGEFIQVINKLRKMKILQGHKTLYITPKILHIKLWTEWWEQYGGTKTFEPEDLILKYEDEKSKVSRNLVQWYAEMLKYAKESSSAIAEIKRLLGTNGPFHKNNLLETELGGSFFLAIVEADPESTIRFLNPIIGEMNRQQLLEFKLGRRVVVRALESIAMRKHLFVDAARLLLILGESENEPWFNNASGIFRKLFSLAPGEAASTELPPKDRFPVLQEALNAGSLRKNLLGLGACEALLETRAQMYPVTPVREGIRDELHLWSPSSQDEIYEVYATCLEILKDCLEKFQGKAKKKTIETILHRAREFLIIPQFFENYCAMLINISGYEKEKVVSTITEVLYYEKENFDESAKKKLEILNEKLIGNSFHSLLERYVGMQIMLDEFDRNTIRRKIEELVVIALDSEKLKPELSWLMSEKAKNAHIFGWELGKKDTNFHLFNTLVKEQEKITERFSTVFLSGYFKAMCDINQERWELELANLSKNRILKRYVPEIASRSGLSNKVGLLILDIVQDGICDFNVLNYFNSRIVLHKISKKVVNKWLEHLIQLNDLNGTFIALDMFYTYYIHGNDEPIPLDLAVEILTHKTLQETSQPIPNTTTDFCWTSIAKKVVTESVEHGMKLAEVILRNFEPDSFYGKYGSQIIEVLDEIIKLKPIEVWRIASRYLGPPIDLRAFNIKNWLHGGYKLNQNNILKSIPFEEICEWIDKDKDSRSRYFATFVTFNIDDFDNHAFQLLVKYGENKDVRMALLQKFLSEGFSGNASEYYKKKKERILQIRKKVSDQNVLRWIDECVETLESKIQNSLDFEERELR